MLFFFLKLFFFSMDGLFYGLLKGGYFLEIPDGLNQNRTKQNLISELANTMKR